MSRLFKLLLVLSAFAVVLSSTAWADTKEVDQTILNWARYKASSDPGTDTLGTTLPSWGDSLIVDTIATGHLGTSINVAAGNLWLGIKNLYIPKNIKILTVYLRGTGLNNLQLTDQYGVIKTPRDTTTGLWHETNANSSTQLIMRFEFDPQPDWDVIRFTATGAATITHFYIVSDCNPRGVPTLTHYGLGVLVLLLIATAFVVYRHRRRVIA